MIVLTKSYKFKSFLSSKIEKVNNQKNLKFKDSKILRLKTFNYLRIERIEN